MVGPAKMAVVVLRVALAACFLGHGAIAISGHVPWLAYFAIVGIPEELARVFLPLVGVHDLIVAALLLLWPCGALYCWCLCWTLFTAALRPLAGGAVLDVAIRAANRGAAARPLVAVGRRVELAGLLGVPLALVALLRRRFDRR